MDSAARLRAIGGSEVTRELKLVAFFRGLALDIRVRQYDVCKAGIATLEKEPLAPVSG